MIYIKSLNRNELVRASTITRTDLYHNVQNTPLLTHYDHSLQMLENMCQFLHRPCSDIALVSLFLLVALCYWSQTGRSQ